MDPFETETMSDSAVRYTTAEQVIRALGAVSIITWVAGLGYLDRHYYETRPRRPDPISGRTYPIMIHHGTRVYVTKAEKLPFDYCGILMLPFIAAWLVTWRKLRARKQVLEQSNLQ